MTERQTANRFSIAWVRFAVPFIVLPVAPVSFADDAGYREELVVTAKIREQRAQDVPLSLSVVTETQAEELGIYSLEDLDRWVPSLDVRTPSGRRSSTITMRGLSPNTTNPQLSGVSIFVDGIYLSGSMSSLRLQDQERVEVVRGPQGALFGRATYTGAIDIVTRNPVVDNLTGRVGATYSQYDVGSTPRTILNGRLDFPLISDKLWGSVSAVYDDIDSFADTPSGSTDVGGEKTTAYGAVLYAEPTDQLSIKLRYNRSEDRDDTALVHITHPDEWLAAGVNTAVVGNNTIWPAGEVMEPFAGTTECQPTFDSSSTSPSTGVKDGVVDTPGSIGRATPGDCGIDQDRDFVSWIIDYDMNQYELSYRGGYFRSKLRSNNDFRPRGNVDGIGVDPFFGPGNGVNPGNKSSFAFIGSDVDFENTSHQIRVVSPSDGRLRWLAGLYYFDEKKTTYKTDNYVPLSSYTGSITGANKIVDRGPDELENIAAFGQIEYDITDQVAVSFEGRLQRETIERKQCPDCLLPSYGDIVGKNLKESENEFLPRVTLTWQPSDDQMYYALYSEGTKSARFNTSEPPGFPGDFADFVYVEPEELHNYEIGAKNMFWDDRINTSLSVYYFDVDEQQQSAQLPDSTVAFTQNVSESHVIGFELEAFASLTENIMANIGIGYADHEYDTDFIPGSSSDRRILNGRTTKGLTSPGVPKTTINAGIEYQRRVMSDYQWMVRLDASYRSKAYIDLANQAWVGDSTIVNLFTDFGTDMWTVSLFARNLNDDKTAQGTFSGSSTCVYTSPAFTSFNSPLQRCSGLGVARGRELGVMATLNFGL